MSEENNTNTQNQEKEFYTTVGRDILKYAPSKIVGMLMNLMLVPIYTKILAPEEYGLYNIATGALSFIAIIFSDWVGLSALRFFQKNFQINNIKPYFGSVLFVLGTNLLLMYVLTFSFFDSLTAFFKVPPEILWIVLFLMVPVAFRALLFQILRAQIKPMTYTVLTIVNQITTILGAVYFITTFNLGATGILLSMAISITGTDLIMLFLSRMCEESDIKQVQTAILKEFYVYGLPILFSSFGMWLITQSNKFVLQHFYGSYFNGIAGVAYNLTYSVMFPLFAIITLAIIPRLINAYEANIDVRPFISRSSGWYISVFLPITIFFCLFPEELVTLFSDKKYCDGCILLPYLAVSAFLLGLTEYTTIKYHLIKKTYIDTIIKIAPNLLGIGLTILLFKLFHIQNALLSIGISSIFAQIFYFLLSLAINIEKIEWQMPENTLKNSLFAIIIATILIFALKNFMPGGLYLYGILFTGFYVFFYSVMRKWQMDIN